MSIKDFINKPRVYSKSHIVQFSALALHTSAASSGMTPVAQKNRQGWTSIQYDRAPGKYTNLVFVGQSKMNPVTQAVEHVRIGRKAIHNIACENPAASETGVRFLPWEQNGVTFMKLDGAAKTWFTGPLSGCSIYIVEDTTSHSLWGFHANRNDVAGANNAAIKHSMMASACFSDAGIAGRILHEALYKRDYHDSAFVFGENRSGSWKFYVVDHSSKSGTFTADDFAAGRKPPPVLHICKVHELPRV